MADFLVVPARFERTIARVLDVNDSCRSCCLSSRCYRMPQEGIAPMLCWAAGERSWWANTSRLTASARHAFTLRWSVRRLAPENSPGYSVSRKCLILPTGCAYGAAWEAVLGCSHFATNLEGSGIMRSLSSVLFRLVAGLWLAVSIVLPVIADEQEAAIADEQEAAIAGRTGGRHTSGRESEGAARRDRADSWSPRAGATRTFRRFRSR